MSKQNNIATALIATNTIIFTIIALDKAYNLQLADLSKQFLSLKRKYKQNKRIDYPKLLNELLVEISSKISPLEEIIQKGLQKDIQKKIQSIHLDPRIKKYLQKKLELLFQQENKNIQEVGKNKISTSTIPKENKIEVLKYAIPNFSKSYNNSIAIEQQMEIPSLEKNGLRTIIATLTCIFVLNGWKPITISSSGNEAFITDTIEDLESFFDSIHLSEEPALKETMPYLETEERIQSILSSDIPYEEKFDYIFILNGISLEEKLNRILESKTTSDKNIYDYILSKSNIPVEIAMDQIISSNITDSSNVLNYIITNNNLSLKQKVWYALTLPNLSFEEIFHSLLLIENASQDKIIEYIIQSDLVSFKTLMDNVLKIPNISPDQIVKYISDYSSIYKENFNTKYNAISLKELTDYTLNIKMLSQDQKVNCIWNLLKEYPLEEKINWILDTYQINYVDYLNIYNLKQKDLTEEHIMILKFFEQVNQLKEQYILEKYNFESKEQLDVVVAGCAAEGKKHYQDLYWVANIFFNRITDPKYSKKYGTNPYNQFIAPGQFEVYWEKYYKDYLENKKYDYASKFALAKQAFYDMFYLGYDGIEHPFLEFRSWNTTDFSDTYIVAGGNRYKITMNESQRIKLEPLLEEKEETIVTRKLIKDTKNTEIL